MLYAVCCMLYVCGHIIKEGGIEYKFDEQCRESRRTHSVCLQYKIKIKIGGRIQDNNVTKGAHVRHGSSSGIPITY